MLLQSRFLQKIAVTCVFISCINLTVVQPVAACPLFDEYDSEVCIQTVTTTYLRRVVSCANGAVIRYEVIDTSVVIVQHTRSFCIDGWGMCASSDPVCGPATDYREIVQQQVCE